jgi:hypothetical protein
VKEIGLPLVNDYAWEYGCHAIVIDIESSQIWDPAWGELQKSGSGE